MRDRCVLPVNAGVVSFERGERVLQYSLLRFFLHNFCPRALISRMQQRKKIPTGNLAFGRNAIEYQINCEPEGRAFNPVVVNFTARWRWWTSTGTRFEVLDFFFCPPLHFDIKVMPEPIYFCNSSFDSECGRDEDKKIKTIFFYKKTFPIFIYFNLRLFGNAGPGFLKKER